MKQIFTFKHRPPRAAVFLSGSGSNAEALLEDRAERGKSYPCELAVLVTDRPKSCRAVALGAQYGVPVAGCDIREFYERHGEDSIALSTPKRRELRELWTDELRKKLLPYRIDFGILAGFVPLCNITRDFPCLNVHPGDLTVEDAGGRRILAGLHYRPVETAILQGFGILRSSVILANPFSGCGTAEMDTGPVLGVSAPMHLQLNGFSLAELTAIFERRVKGAAVEDPLRALAWQNIEQLKLHGDHIVLPAVVRDFAAGRFAVDENILYYDAAKDGTFSEVKTVEYLPDGTCRPWLAER